MIRSMGKACCVLAMTLLPALASNAGAAPPTEQAVHTGHGDFTLLVHAPRTEAVRAGDPAPPLILLVSGEGGWRSFDALLAGWLVDAGHWVGGIDAMKYFWKPQDDRQALATDMQAYADTLARAAGRDSSAQYLIVGFSFGADLAPWIAGEGPRDRIAGLVMIGPDATGSLEFRISEMLGIRAKEHVFDVAQALRGVAGIPVLLLHAEKDANSEAPRLLESAAEPKKLIVIPGGNHHFSGSEEGLRDGLLEGIAWILKTRPRPASTPATKAKP